MPTPTTRLRAVKIDSGSSLNTWGANLNTQALDILDEAIAGVESIALTGNLTLSSANYATDQARNAALVFTGSPAADVTVTVPAVEKTYVVSNGSSKTVTLSAGGTGAALAAGDRAVIWCDGTNCGFGTITSAVVNGLIAAAALTPGTLPGQSGNAGKYLATDGSVALWTALPDAAITRTALASAYTVVVTDRGKWLAATGTWTLTFDPPGTLGPGWYAYVRNDGTGQITVPASDGVTSWVMYPGETRLFQSDGTTLRSLVVTPFSVAFTASGTFTKPPGYRAFAVEVLGAGGGGGSGNIGAAGTQRAGGGGGGGGSYLSGVFAATDLSATVACTVGAGGAGGAGGAFNAGSAGGGSGFGGLLSVFGGGGAVTSGAQGGGGGGALGAGSGGTGGTPTGPEFGGGDGNSSGSGAGNPSVYGGAGGGGGALVLLASTGGRSVFGGNGGAGGGGISSANAVLAPAAAQTAGVMAGASGAGGTATLAGAGADGTAGALGSGGGGGAGATTPALSGAGGAGGGGAVRITGQA